MKRKILKAKGGADASKADFKTPASSFDYEGDAYGTKSMNTYTGGDNNNVTNTNNTTNTQTGGGFKIPVIGPLTAGLRLIQNLSTKPKTAKHPFSANTIKQTKIQSTGDVGGGDQQICPDGTYPPCKTPTTQIKPPAQKNMFLSDFKAYDEGGEVVISSNVDKSLL